MKYLYSLGVAFIISAPFAVSAETVSTIHIDENLMFSAKNVKVIQKAGNTLFTRAMWGLMYVRITVLGTDATPVTRKHGESALIADIAEGDIVNIEGKLASGEGAIMVTPTKIQDLSLLKAGKTLTGNISALAPDTHGFVIKNKSDLKNVAVMSTTTITKGARTIAYSELSVGDKILAARGEFDHTTNTLKADTIEVYQDPKAFVPRNFEGAIVSMGTNELVLNVAGKQYRVSYSSATSILSSNKKPTQLTRFSVGDAVRVYGAIQKTDLQQISAEVIRNLAF